MGGFDTRRHPHRDDLAARYLEGKVTSAQFVTPEPAVVSWPVLDLRSSPDATSLGSQLILGEPLDVYERCEGWAWVQSGWDGYVGYVREDGLSPKGVEPDKTVTALLTQCYPAPDIKNVPTRTVPFLSHLATREVENGFVATDHGWLSVDHLEDARSRERDFVSVAERFLGLPYLWGGRSSFGLDCSALVQLAMMACGESCPRDSDMQAQEVGDLLAEEEPLRRGDLIFWKGHVGIMSDHETLLHATMHRMAVIREPLAVTTARIFEGGNGPITARRRP